MGSTTNYNFPFPSENGFLKDTPKYFENLSKTIDTTLKEVSDDKLDSKNKATSEETIAGTDDTKYTTPATVKSAIDKALERYTPGSGGGSSVPVGIIWLFSSNVIPDGWLLCDGSFLEQSEYPELFAVIGTTYGYQSRTDFRLPYISERVVVGRTPVSVLGEDNKYNTLGNYGGEEEVTLTTEQIPGHKHDISGSWAKDRASGDGGWGAQIAQQTGYTFGVETIPPFMSETGGGKSHNNMPPYIVLNYIIKYK